MTDYLVRFTDINSSPITVPEDSIDRDTLDVSLMGRMFQNYGQDINENLLNILENFSCPESPDTTTQESATPDLNMVSKTQLSKPAHGQFWFNSTRSTLYVYNSVKWVNIPIRGNYAANWGQVLNGQKIPRPSIDGYTFPYSECIWSVSPTVITGSIDHLNCNTDSSATVKVEFRYSNSTEILSGIANYLIIGISGNSNIGANVSPLVPAPTPSPSPTPTGTPPNTPASTPPETPPNTPASTPPSTPPLTPGVSMSATPPETPPNTPASTPPETPPNTPAVTRTPASSPEPIPRWVLTFQSSPLCRSGVEVDYGCREEAGIEGSPCGPIGSKWYATSDCRVGSQVCRTHFEFECRL